MVALLKIVISKTKSTVKNILNAISSRLKITESTTPFLETDEIEFLKHFYDYNSFTNKQIYDEKLHWFNTCQKNSINLICASRQSGKTSFLYQYAQYLYSKNKKVLFVTLGLEPNHLFKYDIDYCNQNNIKIMLLGNNYDVVLIDEMAYYNCKFEHQFKTGLLCGIEKIVAVSTSNRGSLFNNLIINNLKRNANPNLEFANTFNCLVTKKHLTPSYDNAVMTLMGIDNYEVDYECRLV